MFVQRNKYRAIRTTVDNITFHSQREAKRYRELKLLERMGSIKNLELQPIYPIVIQGVKICKVILDFRYVSASTGKIVTEDCKGFDNPVSKIKRKLVQAMYGIEVILC